MTRAPTTASRASLPAPRRTPASRGGEAARAEGRDGEIRATEVSGSEMPLTEMQGAEMPSVDLSNADLPGADLPGLGRLPPLTMLRAFEAVGRLASMRRAADDLGVCHTAVSRHVRNLEAWFGARLVEAGPRGVRLTEAGERLHRAARDGFALIAEATAALRPNLPPRTQARLWCAPGVAARWLTPRLASLEAALPGVAIALRATVDLPDPALNEAEAAIAFGEIPPAGYDAVELERSRIFPVASPEWIASHPPIADLADLARRPLIHEDSTEQWRRFLRLAGHEPTRALAGPRLWYASSAHEAALAGQGVALATRLQAADDMRAGRLVELLATDVTLGSYWFLAAPARGRDPVVARLRRWFEREVADTRGGEPHAAGSL